MKKFLLFASLVLAVSLLLLSRNLLADEITFSFVGSSPNNLLASAGGLSIAAGTELFVTDNKTGVTMPLAGTVTVSTGMANTFTVLPTFIIANYSTGGLNSVAILSPTLVPILTGVVETNAGFATRFPNGAGAFLGNFLITNVDPAVLALFGLGPSVLPEGSVSATFGHDNFKSGIVTGDLGGGSITIEAPAIPEPSSLVLLGSGILLLGSGLRKYLN